MAPLSSQPLWFAKARRSALTEGLVGLWNLRTQNPINIITGEQAVVQVAANAVPTPGIAGQGIRATDGTNKCLQLAASRQALVGSASTQVTIAILSKLEGGTERAVLFDSCGNVGGNDNDGWYWAPNLLAAVTQFNHGSASYATAARSSDTRPVLRIFSAGPSGFWWSEDGAIQATSGTAANALSSTDRPFYLGGSGVDSINTWPQHTFALALWKTEKPQGFASRLGRNIWQLFEAIEDVDGFAAPAAGGASSIAAISHYYGMQRAA